MDREGDSDDDVWSWDAHRPSTNLGLDFFSQPASNIFHEGVSYSADRAGHPRHGAASSGGFDLNSQALQDNDGGSFMELLSTPPPGVVREQGRRGARVGSGRGHGRGRGGGRGGRATGVAIDVPPDGNAAVDSSDIAASTGAKGGRVLGRVVSRGTSSGREGVQSSRSYRAPRRSAGRSKSLDAAPRSAEGFRPTGLHDTDTSSSRHAPVDEQTDEGHGCDASADLKDDLGYDKADWSVDANNAAFCELCVEEIRAGNRNNGYLTTRAYRNIAVKFEEITGLRHSRVQLKNRWEALKRLYSFWLWMTKQTGLGRNVGDDEWWKKHTKNHGEWRKLRYGPPDNLAELEVMFENVAVDGSSSCILGQNLSDDQEGDEGDRSPVSIGNMKRSSGTSATSPKRKTRSPMVRVMKGIWETMQANSSLARQAVQGDFRSESIKKAMLLAVESGAAEGSEEHFMASKLFVNDGHRGGFFLNVDHKGRKACLVEAVVSGEENLVNYP